MRNEDVIQLCRRRKKEWNNRINGTEHIKLITVVKKNRRRIRRLFGMYGANNDRKEFTIWIYDGDQKQHWFCDCVQIYHT